MKITITTSPKEFEQQNYVLGQLMRIIEEAQALENSGFKPGEIAATKAFRKKLMDAFLKAT